MSEWTFAPAALAAVSVAALAAIAVAGCLGRHVYEVLLQDIRERTFDNAWDSVAAFAPLVDADEDPAAVRESRTETRDEARAEAAAATELARVQREADEIMAARLQQERTQAHLRHEATVREIRAAAAAELVQVQQEAERTLAARLTEARAEADRQRDAAVREAKAEAKTEAKAEAKAEAKVVADAEIVRVKQEAEAAMAVSLKQALIEGARERDAAVRKAEAAAAASKSAEATRLPAPPTELVQAPQTTGGHQTLEEHLKEARAKVAHYRPIVDPGAARSSRRTRA